MIERRPIQAAPIKNPDLATAAAVNGSGDSGEAAKITLTNPLPARLGELEARISTALADDSACAASLSNLLQQVEWALPEAEQYAAVERDKSLDPTQSPDPHAARAAMEDAQFAVGRLKTLQPRLLARYQQVWLQEQVREYLAKLAELAPQRNALAQELRDAYAAASSKLLDVFQRVRDFEQRARQQLGNPPSGVEVLERIDCRVLDKCTLPNWQTPDINIWPPPSNFAASFAATMIVPSAGPFWADEQVRTRIAAEQRQQRERMAAHFEQAAREQEERENRTLRENWEASQRRS